MQTASVTPSASILHLDDYRERIELPVPGKVSAGTGYWQDTDMNNLVSFYNDEIPNNQSYDTIAQVVEILWLRISRMETISSFA